MDPGGQLLCTTCMYPRVKLGCEGARWMHTAKKEEGVLLAMGRWCRQGYGLRGPCHDFARPSDPIVDNIWCILILSQPVLYEYEAQIILQLPQLVRATCMYGTNSNMFSRDHIVYDSFPSPGKYSRSTSERVDGHVTTVGNSWGKLSRYHLALLNFFTFTSSRFTSLSHPSIYT